MKEKKRNLSDHLTLLVFKDSYAARTFRVPLGWINRLGAWIGVLILFSALSGFLAVKFYWASRMASPARVQELEIELQDLKASLMPQKQVGAAETSSPTPEAVPNPEASGLEPSLPETPNESAALKQFFPQARLADPAQVPIGIHSPKVSWEGKSLSVNFAIQYRREDGKSQQGRIVILAYGPEAMLTYPAGVMNFSGTGPLLAADQGEYFSVGRFREVKAKFGPVGSQDALRFVDIYLFENNGTVLVHQIIKPSGVKPREPSPRPVSSPAATSAPANSGSDR